VHQHDHDDSIPVDAAGVDEVGVAPWPLLLRRRLADRVGVDPRWAVLIVVLSGLFTVGFTITILAVTLPQIATELDSTLGVVSWTITGPMLAFGVVGPAYGKAGDLWGHKRVFVLGLLGAGIFAALTAVAWSATSLVVFRVLSASAGAATGPSTMAFINRLFPAAERVKPLGYWTFVNAGAPVLGVVAGAPLVEAFGWRAIFVVQAPLCIVGVVLALWLLPDTDRRTGVRFDIAGSITLGLGAVGVLAGVSQGARWGWTSGPTVGMLVGGIGFLVIFAIVERRAAEPLLPLRWLRTRNVALPITTQSLANFAYMGGFLLAPQVLGGLLGYSASKTGLVVIARPLVFALIAPLAGYVTVRIGERTSGVVGSLFVTSSMIGFVLLDASSTTLMVVIALALSGAGFGLSAPALTSLVANAVDDADLGVAGALQQLMSQMGAVLGAVVMTTVQQASENRSGFETSFVPAFAVAAVAAGTATCIAFFVRSTPRE
jgi:MFS family permease